MRKFKVGDMVRVLRDSSYHGFKVGEIITVDEIRSGDVSCILSSNKFVSYNDVEELGPVRTITRKEVVPGGYGIVFVTKENKILIQRGSYSHEQLREAAHTLNQIAEALEDETTK